MFSRALQHCGAQLWLCLLLGLGVSNSVVGVELPSPLQARYRIVDSSQGLSQDSVMALAQDRHGLIWMGTQDGLNRYDGYRIKIYRSGEAGVGLTSGWIYDLQVDADGVLWVATASGLHRYVEHEDRFERFGGTVNDARGFTGNVAYVLHLAKDGALWVGSDVGVSRWDRNRGAFESWALEGGGTAANAHVRAITDDGLAGVWLGTQTGLLHMAADTRQPKMSPADSPLSGKPINALLRDSSGRLWVASDQAGVFIRSPNGDWQQMSPANEPALPHPRIHALMQDRAGAVWVGHEAGVSRFVVADDGGWHGDLYRHRAHQPRGLGRGRVTSLLQDREGSVWVGTWDAGASLLNSAYSRFLSYSPEFEATQAMRVPQVNAVAAEGDQLWLGSLAGLFRFAPEQATMRPVPSTAGLEVFGLALGQDFVWIGTGRGLRRLDRRSGELVRPALPAEVEHARIRRLFIDGDRLWLFAELAGLFVFEGEQLRLLARHQFPANVNKIVRLNDDIVMVGASDGLYWLDREGQRILHRSPIETGGAADTLPDRPTDVVRDSQGGLWVATYGGGLLRMNFDGPEQPQRARFTSVTAGKGLRNEGINALAVDFQDRLWMATDRGISRFDPIAREVVNFDAVDGAIARGYYFNGSTRSDSGLIAFGSKDGFTVFDPALQVPDDVPAAPLLLGLLRDNVEWRPQAVQPESPLLKPLHLLNSLVLPPGSGRSVGVAFASPDHVMPQSLRYRYRLDHFDADWLPVGDGLLQASYTNLAPGKYPFRAQAIDRMGRASREAVLEIEIQPHWWQTVWARTFAVLALLLLVAFLHLTRVRILNAQQTTLRAEVAERTQALNEARRRAESALQNVRSSQVRIGSSAELLAVNRVLAALASELQPGDSAKNLCWAQQSETLLKQLRALNPACQAKVDFELQPELESWLAHWRAGMVEKGVQIELACAAGLQLHGIAQYLRDSLDQLLAFALARGVGEDGRGRIWITARRLEGGTVELRLADNRGAVVAPEPAAMFDPPTDVRAGWPEIGVFLARQLLAAGFGARIDFKTVSEVGSEFVLLFPVTGLGFSN